MSNALLEERPPTAEEIQGALASFVASVRTHYGSRVVDIVLFGSRSRGDHRPESDADIAIILKDGDWRFWAEKLKLADLTYDQLMEFGLRIQPWPISASAWLKPETHHNPRLVEAMRRDGRTLLEAA